jgi:predicted NBD/HSP70 family sugar kinase
MANVTPEAPPAGSTSRRSVVTTLRGTQPASITELAMATGLPRSTVAQTVTVLLRDGLVLEHPARASGRGRPSRTFSLFEKPRPIAVLISAAHGTVSGVITTSGVILSQVSGPPLDGDAESRFGGPALELLDAALANAGVAPADLSLAIVGLPGPSLFPRPASPPNGADSPRRTHHLRRFQVWDGRPAAAVVGEHLGCRTFSENDANLAAAGEAASGAGAGFETVMFVSLAFGTSAGLVVNGRLHRGRTGLTGEIGHLHTVDHGQLCQCGGRGCFWLTTSIPALLEELAAAHHQQFTVAEIGDAARLDQHGVVRALVGFGHALGRRLADAVVVLDPDAIVIDGALGDAALPIVEGVSQAVQQYAPPAMARDLPIIPGTLGVSAPLVGAAALARVEGLLDFVSSIPAHN